MIRALILAVVGVTLGLWLLLPAPAHAVDPLNQICLNGDTQNSDVCSGRTSTNPITGSTGILLRIIQIVALAAGVAAVIVAITAGFQYITSGGEPAKIESAKNTLIYAVAGIIIIALAESIISFVLSKL